MSKADYFTQLGALFVPIGVSLIAIAPSLQSFGVVLIVIGILSLLGGWSQVLREDAKKKRDDAKQQESRDEESAWREGQTRSVHYDILLQEAMLKRLKVPLTLTSRKQRIWEEERDKALERKRESEEEDGEL